MKNRWPFYWFRRDCCECHRPKPRFTNYCDSCWEWFRA